MAATTITNAKMVRNAATAMPTAGTVAANEGVIVSVAHPDEKMLLRLVNTDSSATHTAVIVKGNALQGVADLEIPLAPSADVVVVVESGKFVNVSGDNKGKLIVKDKKTTATNIKVSAIQLP